MRRSCSSRAVFKEIIATTRCFDVHGTEIPLVTTDRRTVNPNAFVIESTWRGLTIRGTLNARPRTLWVEVRVKDGPIDRLYMPIAVQLLLLSEWAAIVSDSIDLSLIKTDRMVPVDGIPWEIHALAQANIATYLVALQAARQARL